MLMPRYDFARRDVLKRIGLAAAWFTVPGAFANDLVQTPAQTEGPFYPDKLPLDTDNDLDRKSTRLNSSHIQKSRMPSSA